MTYSFKHIAYLTLLLVAMLHHTQVSHAQKVDFTFEQLPPEIVMSNAEIWEIVQDHEGFIWIASWWGLWKFDGYSNKCYYSSLSHQHGLESSQINCLYEDFQKRLWLGTNDSGLYLYDRKHDKFIAFQESSTKLPKIKSNNILSIGADEDHLLWVGTDEGLSCFDLERGIFIAFEDTQSHEEGLGDFLCSASALSKDNIFWLGGREQGLARIVKGEQNTRGTLARYSLAPNDLEDTDSDYARHNFIYKITPSEIFPNTLWIGTKMGVKKVTYDSADTTKLSVVSLDTDGQENFRLSHNSVNDMVEDVERNGLWIATFKGLNFLDFETGKIIHFFRDENNNNSIANNVIHSLFLDQTDHLWINTFGNINRINFADEVIGQVKVKDKEESVDRITSFAVAHQRDGYWVGTKGSGLCFVPATDGIPNHEASVCYSIKTPLAADYSSFVSEVIVSKAGELWITTEGAGIIRIKEKDIPQTGGVLTNVQQYTKGTHPVNDYPMTAFESRDGSFWFGYWDKGIERYDPVLNTFQHFHFTEGSIVDLYKFPVIHFEETQEQGALFLWVGTSGGGLLKLQYNTSSKTLKLIKEYKLKTPLIGDFITSIYTLPENGESESLIVSNEQRLTQIHLPTDSLTVLNEKYASAQTSTSADRFALGDESKPIWLPHAPELVQMSTDNDGLEVRSFTFKERLIDGNIMAVINDQLVLANEKGLYYFSPNELTKEVPLPKVALVDFRLFNQSVSIGEAYNGTIILDKNLNATDTIQLSHLDNMVSFEFSGMGVNNPQQLKYAYKLEGLQEDWIYTDADERVAHFTNLPYKTLEFKVKASNEKGSWSPTKSVTLIVSPPFWRTNWAYAIWGLLFVALLYGLFRVLNLRSEFRYQLQLEKVEREQLQKVNQMKLRFFTNISHELRTPLTLIISPLEQLIKRQFLERQEHNSLIRMHKNANRLLHMINQLLDIRKSESGLRKLKVAEGNFVKFANEIVLSFKSIAKEKDISLVFSSSDEVISIWYDRDEMEKVLFNLLSNALKFTPEKGEIRLHLSEKEDHLLIALEDTGMGIPDTQKEQIFNRFYQLEENPEETRGGGTGIGLALTKSIVEAHKGKVWVEDNPTGEGSVFYIQIQLGEDHFKAEEKIKAFRDSETLANYSHPVVAKMETQPIEKPATKSRKNLPLILLVEDNEDIRTY
ncbi:MAG: ATP-binding protein, partial [Bacteroidota bacterium]